MVKKEYTRMMKSIMTISIVIILIVISIISFYISLSDKNMFISQLNNPAEDINIESLKTFIQHYNGFKFLFDFWYVSDFYFIFIIALLLFVGIFLSYQIQKHKDESYGNLLVTRISYKKYLNNTLISQSLYIFSIITIANFISLIIAFFIGGFGGNTELGSFKINIIQALIIIFIQNIFMSFIVILINGCSLLISCLIRNKYILQVLPLLIFFIFPQLIISTLGNFSDIIGNIALPFVLMNELIAISNIINDYVINDRIFYSEIIYYLIPILTYFILFIVLYCINLKKNERDYI